MTHFLGIDSSTTGVKALLIDETGGVAGTATTELALSTPKPLWSEQDPLDWWSGAVDSIQQLLRQTGLSGDDVATVGLTGQMHGLTLLDGAGSVLRPAILWIISFEPQITSIRRIYPGIDVTKLLTFLPHFGFRSRGEDVYK